MSFLNAGNSEARCPYCGRKQKRSNEQNAKMWALLRDISAQVVWHGQKLSAEDWKCVFSASLKKQQVVPGLDGGFVVMGQSTSSMTKREMSDLIDLAEAFAAEHDVQTWRGCWS